MVAVPKLFLNKNIVGSSSITSNQIVVPITRSLSCDEVCESKSMWYVESIGQEIIVIHGSRFGHFNATENPSQDRKMIPKERSLIAESVASRSTFGESGDHQ